MKHRLKGLLALVLSLVMVLSMVTVSTASQSSGGGSAPTEYHVSVGGTKVTSANAANVLGDGKVSYDPDTNTLTLNNFTFEDNTRRSAISSNQDLTINLIGDNSVTASNTNISGATAIIVDGNLTINGTGSLTASGISEGIHADNVTIESGEVTAVGEKYGLSASNVNIKGGTVTATGDEDCGIYTKEGNITISGGTVKATGEKYGIFADKGSLSSGGMKVTISGGAVTANAADNGGIGIYADGGEIAISGDNTQVTVGGATGLSASTVNILENSTVTITTNATAPAVGKAIDATTLNFGSNWYQWSTNNPGETTPISSATKAFALNNYGGTGQNPVPTSFTIEKISTGGQGTVSPQPPTYYPIYIPTVEDEPEVTTPDTFDGGIASAVVVTILSATGGAWLAKKKD